MTVPATDPLTIRRPAAPLSRQPRRVGHYLVSGLVAALVLLPVAALLGVALQGGTADISHLARTVLPGAVATTLLLLALVAIGTLSIGITSAWIIANHDFPLRRFLAFALVLPVAIPPYLAAYAWTDFFHFTGPPQTLLRMIFGWKSARDYWFPDVRSTIGAAIVLSSVLFPYVYLTARMVFMMQGRNLADAARMLGARPGAVFFRILLPVSRPALAAGLALALMEALNDVGAAEYLGVRTLTLSVFSTWLNRNSLEGAAQISALMLVLVLALVLAEQWARRSQRFQGGRATHMKAQASRTELSGWRAAAAFSAAALPVFFGFGIPLLVFGGFAMRRLHLFSDPALIAALFNSVAAAGATALATVSIALVLLNASRHARSGTVTLFSRLAISGYAIPGTILSIGLLFVLARMDSLSDMFMRQTFGISTGLLLTGTAAAVVIALTIRFLALAEGAIRGGYEKLPPNLDDAARSLGRSPAQSTIGVMLPLLKPAIQTAAVLVFVDTIKELSATMLLRPFGFSTLATHVYESASRGVPEQGSVAALLIIVVAVAPVIALSRALMGDEEARI